MLSPHDFSLFDKSEPMAWSYVSQNAALGREIGVDMLQVVRTVEELSGKSLVVERELNLDDSA